MDYLGHHSSLVLAASMALNAKMVWDVWGLMYNWIKVFASRAARFCLVPKTGPRHSQMVSSWWELGSLMKWNLVIRSAAWLTSKKIFEMQQH